MATLMDEDRRRALKSVADCAETCEGCGQGGIKSGEAAMQACVAGCLDCAVICRGAETLLSRGSSFDTQMLKLASEVAAACGVSASDCGTTDCGCSPCTTLCQEATKEFAAVGAA